MFTIYEFRYVLIRDKVVYKAVDKAVDKVTFI